MRRGLRVAVATLAATVLVPVGLVALGASPSSAATVTVPYRCQLNAFGVTHDALQSIPVTITAPASVNSDTALDVVYDIAPGSTPLNAGAALTAATTTTSATVEGLAGAVAGSGTGIGAPTAPAAVAAFAPLPLALPITTSIPPSSFANGNSVDIRPGVLQVAISSPADGVSNATMICTPDPSAPVAATVDVLGVTPQLESCVVIDPAPSCATGQNLNATITAGNLSQQVYAVGANPDSTSVVFPSVSVAPSTQTVTAPFNRVTVTDLRGGAYGMSLTAQMAGPLLGTGGSTIAASQLGINSLGCVGTAAGSAPATAGPGGSLGGPVLLCQTSTSARNAANTTSGVFDVTGGWTLDVPAFQSASVYIGTVVLTLA